MNRTDKYRGVFPALYACYDKKGEVDLEAVKALTEYLINSGVNGVYVGGCADERILVRRGGSLQFPA